MNQETRICQNCKQNFVIEPEDFAFYERIKVPPPTWCPECRLMRRLIWRNEKTVYKRSSNRSGKTIFTIFSPDNPIKVWSYEEWLADDWDPIEYGRDYDFNKPFFEQLKELMLAVPWSGGSIYNLVRSNYCQNANNLKGCYLVFGSSFTQNSFYSTDLFSCQDCYDSKYLTQCEISYEGFLNQKCYRSFFSSHCEESQNIFFCHNCTGVNNCFGCVGLRSKSYHIFNRPYSREEYFKKLDGFDLGSFRNLNLMKNKIEQFRLQTPVKYMHGQHNANVVGEYIDNSKNVLYSYHITSGENLKFCFGLGFGAGAKDCYDYSRWGAGSELIYDTVVCGDNLYLLKFCWQCFSNCKNLTYCNWCQNSSDLFGCVSLRNKQYCILNEQYTKEEYESLVPKIIDHMNQMPYVDSQGRVYKYGEFFPPELSPFAYNETIAQEYFPKTKEQALAQGYRWKDPEERNIKPDYYTKDLADHIKDVKDDILGKIIQCAHSQIKEDGSLEANCNEQCTTAFKIIPQELEFYRRMNLPLPRLCPNCRHFQRLKQRNPLKLWHRKCQCQGTYGQNPNNSNIYQNQTTHFHQNKPCSNEFYTSYAPDRPEIVYCDKCYQAEVV